MLNLKAGDNMKHLSNYLRSYENPNYFIKYRININNFNDYWSNDFSSIFKNYQFAIIEEINIPLYETNTEIGRNLLQLFCDVMTIEHRIILFNLEDLELWTHIHNGDDYEELEMWFLELLDEIGFADFYSLNWDFDNNVYFYTRSKLGNMILNQLEDYYSKNIS